jgi:hypothetical protein
MLSIMISHQVSEEKHGYGVPLLVNLMPVSGVYGAPPGACWLYCFLFTLLLCPYKVSVANIPGIVQMVRTTCSVTCHTACDAAGTCGWP